MLVQYALDLRKILGVAKKFLKSRSFLFQTLQRRKFLTRVKYCSKIWKYHGNLAVMSSKSGRHDAGIRGRGGHGKAFDASRPNLIHLSSDEMFCQNSVGAAAVCSKDGGRAEEEKDSSNVLEEPGVKIFCEIKGGASSIHRNSLQTGGAGADSENGKSRESSVIKPSQKFDISIKSTSNGGCGGQKVLQVEKVADKLALLDDSCSKSRKRTRVS